MICSGRHFAASSSSNAGISNASAGHRNYDYIRGKSVQHKNVMCYDPFMMMCTGDGNNFDSSCVKDSEGDDSDISKAEDVVVRMDLTDDLLHMVCYMKRIISVLFVSLFK